MRMVVFFLFLLVSFNTQAAKPLTWCAYYNWAPWIYPVGDFYDGILIEQLTLFEKEHKIEVEPMIRENWKRCQADVESGEIDIILGANKTPQRERIFHYLGVPSFVNKSVVSAYTFDDNRSVRSVSNIEELKQYKLAMIRGNSLGNKIDGFINSITPNNRYAVSRQQLALRMLAAQRMDYTFLLDSSYSSVMSTFAEENPELKNAKFRKIFTTERATPAFVAFTKEGEVFARLGELWTATINAYYDSVDIEERVAFHREKFKKYQQ